MRVVVIGSGIVGLFAAYFLLKSGHRVIIVERNRIPDGASIYNAGLITPSFAPTPSISPWKLLYSLTGLSRPLSVSLGPVLRDRSWFVKALRSGVGGAASVLLDIASRSLALYREIVKAESFDVDLHTGVLGIYRRFPHPTGQSNSLGGEIVQSDTLVEWGYRGLEGGVLYSNEIAVDPEKLFHCLRSRVRELGASALFGGAARFLVDGGKALGIAMHGERIEGDVYVVTAGAWSRELCEPLRFDPRVLPARGFVLLFSTSGRRIVERPALLEDYGVGISQHGLSTLRVTGFFELVGFDTTFNPSRRNWLLSIIRRHLIKQNDLQLVASGCGFRPCTPDQLPVVGAIPGHDNVFIATGHCRLGLTLAPITGYMVEAMISGRSLDVDTASLAPSRF